MAKVRAIPEGMHSVTPQLTVKGCAEALEFYKKAFGAVEIARAADPSGTKVWHAMIRIGDSILFCNDDFPEMGGMARASQLWIYSDGVDAAFQRAVDAGAKVLMPLDDMFWGDRMGKVGDKWGNEWALAQRVKDMSPDELERAQDAVMAEMNREKK
jgi:PhnB protein